MIQSVEPVECEFGEIYCIVGGPFNNCYCLCCPAGNISFQIIGQNNILSYLCFNDKVFLRKLNEHEQNTINLCFSGLKIISSHFMVVNK